MASYHLSAKIIGRSDGRSVVAAAAYRAGQRIERAETGDCPDYTRKGGIVSADLLTPRDAPKWARDRAELWNAVEAVETRKNSQLARELELALPNELTEEQARALVIRWSQDELVSRGMVADVCIHDPEPAPGCSRNRHAHILCTVRGFTGEAWAKTKDRTWNDKALLERWRETWALAQNAALEAAGYAHRVDHRTLQAQRDAALDAGDTLRATLFDRPPEPVLGIAAGAIEKRARHDAHRRGVSYAPATPRGRALFVARGVREVILAGLLHARDAAREIFALRMFGASPSPQQDLDDEGPTLSSW